jgi:hypothetical protein
MARDIWNNIEAESREEAILKIGELSVDEQNHEDTETEVFVRVPNCIGTIVEKV